MSLVPQHPVLALVDGLDGALKGVADVDPAFMSPADKARALVGLTGLASRLEELRLRVLAGADDVALEHGARDAAAWLAAEGRLDTADCRRDRRLAQALDRRPRLADAVRSGEVHLVQAAVVARALRDLPDGVGAEVVDRAEAALVAEAERFDPRRLRILGRRVLEVVAPEVADDHERRLLEREDAHAARQTWLTTRQRGDGTTDVRMRIPDLVAQRMLTYLQSFTAPRRQPEPDRRPYEQRLGHAFGAFLEAVDPQRLPLHGGDATTVVVTVDHQTLLTGLGTALIGDTPISAGQARRLACTAGILPAVLGDASQVLDLGRTRRLFSPAQRKAMGLRQTTCGAEGCEIPATWCEAHHAGEPWAAGGRTDLREGLLLCSWHHHRAHDGRYRLQRTAGGVRLHRRT